MSNYELVTTILSVPVAPSRIQRAQGFLEAGETTAEGLRAIVAALANMGCEKEAAVVSSIVRTVAALEVESM